MPITAYNFHAASGRWRRHPVLTVMMVYSLGFALTALLAVFAMWRANSGHSNPQHSGQMYVVRISAAIAREDNSQGASPCINIC